MSLVGLLLSRPTQAVPPSDGRSPHPPRVEGMRGARRSRPAVRNAQRTLWQRLKGRIRPTGGCRKNASPGAAGQSLRQALIARTHVIPVVVDPSAILQKRASPVHPRGSPRHRPKRQRVGQRLEETALLPENITVEDDIERQHRRGRSHGAKKGRVRAAHGVAVQVGERIRVELVEKLLIEIPPAAVIRSSTRRNRLILRVYSAAYGAEPTTMSGRDASLRRKPSTIRSTWFSGSSRATTRWNRPGVRPSSASRFDDGFRRMGAP